MGETQDRLLPGIEGLIKELNFIGVANGYALVSQTKDLKGWQLSRLDHQGKTVGAPSVIWSSGGGWVPPSLAVNGGVLAGSWRVVPSGKPGGGGECRLGLLDLSSGTPGKPVRVGDQASTTSVLPDAGGCWITRLGGGFLAVWSVTLANGSFALYGQRFDLSGKEVGRRLTLGAGANAKQLLAGVSTAWTGKAAVVVHADENNAPVLSRVDSSGVLRRHRLPARVSKLPLVRWTGRALHLTWEDKIAAVNDAGVLLAGPESAGTSARQLQTATLGSATVLSFLEYVGSGSTPGAHYLAAALISDDLKWISARAGVAAEPTNGTFILAGSGDGKGAAVLYSESGLRLATLGCSTTRPFPPGGSWPCPGQSPLVPLSGTCTGEACHALVRLDYLTLGLEGYALAGGPYKATDKAAGLAVAGPYLKKQLGVDKLVPDGGVGGPEPRWINSAAGLHLYTLSTGDPSGFAMVSALTGQIVAAGGIIWAGKGHYWQPPSWLGPSRLRCGSAAAKLANPAYLSGGSCGPPASASKYSAKDALDLALRLNLSHGFATGGAPEAYVMLYTPQIGHCDPLSAEYLVVLSKKRK